MILLDNIKNKIKNIDKDAIIVICINIIIFYLVNLFFDLKYEEVDDFIIYNLYSGLDGTFSIYGIYIHPFLCAILSVLFRVVSSINWHTIFLMSMEFICFAIIGYIFIKKHNSSRTSIVIYSILAAVFHTTLLLLLQYTSIATLLMATALYMLLQEFENNKGKYYKVTYLTLFTIGAMLKLSVKNFAEWVKILQKVLQIYNLKN